MSHGKVGGVAQWWVQRF